MRSGKAVLAAVAACLIPLMAASAPKPKPPPPPPVNLEIESPAFTPDKPLGVMYTSGTALEFKATIKGKPLGIATDQATRSYVGKGFSGWIVYADPDGCLEIALSPNTPINFQRECLAALYPQIPENEFFDPALIVPDETYLQFTIDRDTAGAVDDFPWNPEVRAALADPLQSGEPEFLALTKELIGGAIEPKAPELIRIGPFTGNSVDDGFGYGADDDFPGLVVLSARGVGLVYDEPSFVPVSPRTQRNLAGFLESVSYELKSNDGKTVIHAGMTLPDGLIAPAVSLDSCLSGGVVNNPPECDGGGQFQIDGGPIQSGGAVSGWDFWEALIPTLTFEIRAFVVAGNAPSQLSDLNGDNVITAADAGLAGYTVLSNEAVTQFRQFPAFLCGEQNGLSTVFGTDYDGNGSVQIHIQCPPGPGAIKPVPQ